VKIALQMCVYCDLFWGWMHTFNGICMGLCEIMFLRVTRRWKYVNIFPRKNYQLSQNVFFCSLQVGKNAGFYDIFSNLISFECTQQHLLVAGHRSIMFLDGGATLHY
jgi:hypothetical protein